MIIYKKGAFMNSDISIMIDNIKLNIRSGIIFKYQNKILVEVPRVNFYNSVIPGGRLKMGEFSRDTIKREIKEEMNFDIQDSKLKYMTTHEEKFSFDNVNYYEIFFIYKYDMDENDYQELLKIKENLDNHGADYKFITEEEFKEYNLLPLIIRDLFKEI